MLEREDDVNRAGGGRQSRDQRADEGTRALNNDRRRHHNGRGHDDLQQKTEQEELFGHAAALLFRLRVRNSIRFQAIDTASPSASAHQLPSGTAATCSVRTARPKSEQSENAARQHRGGRRTADAVMQDQHDAGEDHRKGREHTGRSRADAETQRDHRANKRSNQQRADGEIGPAQSDRRHADMAILAHDQKAERKDDDVEQHRDPCRGRNRRERNDRHEPGEERARHRDQKRLALREQDVNHRIDPGRGIEREACERALRNELRIVIERQEHIGRPRRHRQCRDQRADGRTGAFRGHRRGDDEKGRDRHFDGERQREIEFGRH